MSNLDWNDILDTLEEQKCVLFLGRGAYLADGGNSLSRALQQYLNVENVEHPHIRLYNEDGFFLFRKNRFRRKVVSQMKAFYDQTFPETEDNFTRLARIPFNMFISLTPDNLLARTFDTQNFDYQSDFYFRNRKASSHFELPTKQKPLIYNLLGNIEEPESLVLTHQDFFDYLNSVFVGNSMNEDLKDTLERAERYIFLGLPYEKWYFQLLLRVLSMHSDKLKEVERLALKEFENPNLHQIYQTEFKIEFIPSKIDAFVQTLYTKCEQAGILKMPPPRDPKEQTIKSEHLSREYIQELIASARTADALLHLKVLLQQKKPRSQSLYNDLIVLRNRFKLLRQRDRNGTIDSRDLKVEDNQIVETSLQLLDKAVAL